MRPLGQHNVHNWQGELTQNQVQKETVKLTFAISCSLFEMFDYTDLSEETVERVISNEASDLKSLLEIE